MSQSKKASLAESVLNVFVGFVVAIAAQFVIFPLYGIAVNPAQQIEIALLFTVVSIARSYVLRRTFNFWSKK